MTEEQKKYYNAMKKLGSKKPQKPIPRPLVSQAPNSAWGRICWGPRKPPPHRASCRAPSPQPGASSQPREGGASSMSNHTQRAQARGVGKAWEGWDRQGHPPSSPPPPFGTSSCNPLSSTGCAPGSLGSGPGQVLRLLPGKLPCLIKIFSKKVCVEQGGGWHPKVIR